jgi:hypothetical protein
LLDRPQYKTGLTALLDDSFQNTKTIDDLPHWRVLELPPNPADTNLDTYFQYLYSYLRAHMPPREHHRTFAADPRDPQELYIHNTQQALREDFQLALLAPHEGDSALHHFIHSYELAHGHPPRPEDVPLWHTFSFPLSINNSITPDTTRDFHIHMYSRMLPTHRPIPPPPDTNLPTSSAPPAVPVLDITIPPHLAPSSPPTTRGIPPNYNTSHYTY